MAADARRAAVEALLRVNHGGGYSNIVLDNLLKSGALSAQDQVFATRLLYGVVERRLTIDFALEQCASMPLKRMHPPCWKSSAWESISFCIWTGFPPPPR